MHLHIVMHQANRYLPSKSASYYRGPTTLSHFYRVRSARCAVILIQKSQGTQVKLFTEWEPVSLATCLYWKPIAQNSKLRVRYRADLAYCTYAAKRVGDGRRGNVANIIVSRQSMIICGEVDMTVVEVRDRALRSNMLKTQRRGG